MRKEIGEFVKVSGISRPRARKRFASVNRSLEALLPPIGRDKIESLNRFKSPPPFPPRRSGACMSLGKQILDLRQAGRFREAFDYLADARQQSRSIDEARPALDAFREHFLGFQDSTLGGPLTGCLLLDFARQSWQTHPQDVRVVLATHFGFNGKGVTNRDAPIRGLWAQTALPLLDARLHLVSAILDDDDMGSFANQLWQSVQKYEQGWLGCAPSAGGDSSQVWQSSPPPASLKRLPIARWKAIFEGLEQQLRLRPGAAGGAEPNWDHPGLIAAVETLLYLSDPEQDLPSARESSTWVLLAQAEVIDVGGAAIVLSDGLMARLVVEGVPGGAGYLYPDPRGQGYVPTGCVDQQGNPCSTFEQGLRTAMTVVRRWLGSRPCDFDFRWRLTPIDPRSVLELPAPVAYIEGPSATAAFACSVRAVLEGTRLDGQTALTACFEAPLTIDPSLALVGGVLGKLFGQWQSAPRNASLPQFFGTVQRERIDRIVLSAAQFERKSDPRAIDVDFRRSKIRLIPAATFDVAYHQLSRHAQITDAVKRALKTRAEGLLAELGGQYVSPRLYREGEPTIDENGIRVVPRNYLLPDETAALILGKLPRGGNRIAILAKSGFGKSTLLMGVQSAIASAPGDLVPLRLGACPTVAGRNELEKEIRPPLLSGVVWNSDRDEVLSHLAKELLGNLKLCDVAGHPLGLQPTERNDWLSNCADRGEIVFLLDALDQTHGEMDTLRKFLNEDGIRDCPVLLTGRPETVTTKEMGYQGVDWKLVQLDVFNDDGIRAYCGNATAARLLAKREWRPLIEVPILLKQMKELAEAGKLEGLKNLEAVYHASLRHLLTHGKPGLTDAGLKLSLSQDMATVECEHAQAAWQTIRGASPGSKGSNFTGVLKLSHLDSRLSDKQLLQLNLVALGAYVEEGEQVEQRKAGEQNALIWRHLSFCEHFAGVHLAGLPPAEQSQILREIGRELEWQNTLRFALSAADRRSDLGALRHLAAELIAAGNPLIVWLAMRDDKIELHDGPAQSSREIHLDSLCRWLVHRDRDSWTNRYDSDTSPWRKVDLPRPEVTTDTIAILESLFDPAVRDSRWLHAAWELLVESGCRSEDDNIKARCEAIRDRFLAEFEALVAAAANACRGRPPSEWPAPHKHVLSLLPDECFSNLGLMQHAANYCQCPPAGWQHPTEPTRDPLTYWRGSAEGVGDDDERPRKKMTIPQPFLVQRTPMTNAQFEVFDPTHSRYRRRDWKRSETDTLDDHPVIEVTWYQTALFAVWLTGANKTFGTFRLPSETEWEFACRAGRDGPNDLFGVSWRDAGGNDRYDSLSSREANFNGEYPEGAAPKDLYLNGTVPAGGLPDRRYPANGFGLLDMHGQVYEWCQNEFTESYDAEPSGDDSGLFASLTNRRVLRGGFWGSDAWGTRSADRSGFTPGDRDDIIGFRLSRTP